MHDLVVIFKAKVDDLLGNIYGINTYIYDIMVLIQEFFLWYCKGIVTKWELYAKPFDKFQHLKKA